MDVCIKIFKAPNPFCKILDFTSNILKSEILNKTKIDIGKKLVKN